VSSGPVDAADFVEAVLVGLGVAPGKAGERTDSIMNASALPGF